MRIRHILVPTDFSSASMAAWRYASAMARRFNSRVHLLHVIAPPYNYDVWATGTMPYSVAEFLKQAKPAAERQLARFAPRHGPRGRRVTSQVTTGSTVEDILKAIKSTRADLVVMGTHGRSLVGQFFLGRTAERIVSHSPVPVVTVRATRAQRRGRSA